MNTAKVVTALAAALYFATAPWPAVVAGALLAFGAAAWLLARSYARRND